MLRHWNRIALFVGLVALAACGGSEAVAPDDAAGEAEGIHWPDTAGDTATEADSETPAACETDQECLTLKGAAPACQTWTCAGTSGCVLKPLDNGSDCDDGNKCTAADKCLNGQCLGDGVSCDDQNACTDDTCTAEAGCAHANNSKTCNDANLCTTNDHCVAGACTGDADPKCQCDTDAECAAFDDGNKCNGTMMCVGSQCVVDAASVVDCSATQVGVCQTVACDPISGQCKTANKANGTECSDGDFCSLNDACKDGACKGQVRDCDDQNACTDDSCDKLSGCVYQANAATCDDGDLCTTGDKCTAGACKGTLNADCACQSNDDCKAFDDGDVCNGTMACTGGKCAVDPATVKTCDPGLGGPCKVVFCDAQSGECRAKNELDGTACDDSNKCTANDVCAAGACVGAGVSCDDQNPCTDDGCTAATGCTHTNNTLACDDGNACTTGDQCAAGACAGTGSAGCSCATDADCAAQEDGDKCNGTLVCTAGACTVDPSTVVACPAAQGCAQYACEKQTGACTPVTASDGTACEDGDACTTGETCTAGTCKGGSPVVCDDTNLCTADHCDPTVGCQYEYTAEACDDGNPCTTNDACKDGACTGSATTACVCAADADCTVYDDGNKCNGVLACVENKCVVKADSQVACEPAPVDGCTLSYCEPETGKCVTPDLPDGKPCSDGDACTQVDVCKGGECEGSGPLTCADDNPCTDDACDPATGCAFAYNTAACDDNDPCTAGDACDQGVCQPGQDTCGDTCVADWTLECGASDAWSTTYGGTTNVVDAWSCNAEDGYAGPEYTYRFAAPYAGKVTVYLTDETDETDLLVVDSQGQGCHSNNCSAWDYSTVTLTVTEGQQFFFVVDGYEGATGDYVIHVQCTPDHELVCDDGLDDDDDGLIDCADSTDCLGTEACPVPHCQPDWTLTCGSGDTWWNYGSGSTDLIDAYACTPYDQSGPEYAYTFVAPIDGDVKVALTGVSADLDLMILEAGAENQCLPANCVAAGDLEGDDSVTFTAKAGTTYYVVVDGYNGNEGSYSITLACPGAAETLCNDFVDDDLDGLTDCADSDCDADPACATFESNCTDGVDDDGDGYTDCDDAYDCYYEPTCGWVEANCTDGVDDDGDGVTDCDDADCAYDEACYAPSYETDCANAMDDDFDGDTDCGDSDCAYSTACGTYEINCTDGVDDDGDGLTDCLDGDCYYEPTCGYVETDCSNTMDDDFDGLTDCDDDDCWYDDACYVPTYEWDCGNFFDDDYDGFTDCDDDDCWWDSSCL